MERRKFLKGIAVLAILPIVGVAKETYKLKTEMGFDSLADMINDMGIRNNTHFSNTPLVEIDMTHLSPHTNFSWAVDKDVKSMYMTNIMDIT